MTLKIDYFLRPGILQQEVVLVRAWGSDSVGGDGSFRYVWARGACKEWFLDGCTRNKLAWIVCTV